MKRALISLCVLCCALSALCVWHSYTQQKHNEQGPSSNYQILPFMPDVDIGINVDLGDEFAEYSLLKSESEPKNGYYSVDTVFIAPSDATEAEIENHAKTFATALCEAEPSVFAVCFHYYDDPMFYEFGDIPIAFVKWAPYGDTANRRHVPVGDFSHHDLRCRFYPCNEDYALSDEEKQQYKTMQETYYSIAGEYANYIWSKDGTWEKEDILFEWEYDDYVATAKVLNTSVEELVNTAHGSAIAGRRAIRGWATPTAHRTTRYTQS